MVRVLEVLLPPTNSTKITGTSFSPLLAGYRGLFPRQSLFWRENILHNSIDLTLAITGFWEP